MPTDPPSSVAAVVAPGIVNTADLGGTVEVVVRVRSRAGEPLAGATVRFVSAGPPEVTVERTTDAMGFARATLSGRSPLRVEASRERFQSESVPVARDPATTGPARVTVFLDRPYHPDHLFPWQNPILREALYKNQPGARDPGQAGVAAPTRVLTRVDRLADFVRLYSGIVGVPLPAPPPLPPSSEPIPARRRTPEQEERALAASNERMGRELQEERDRWQGRIDAARAERQRLDQELEALPSSPRPRSPEARERTRVTARRAAVDRRVTSLEQQRDRAVAPRERALGAVRSRQSELGLIRSGHRALVEASVALFEADDRAAAADRKIPGWVRYMVVHYSGLQYQSAHGSHYPPQWVVWNVRERALDGRMPWGSPSTWTDEGLRDAQAELQALLGPPGSALRAGVGRRLEALFPEPPPRDAHAHAPPDRPLRVPRRGRDPVAELTRRGDARANLVRVEKALLATLVVPPASPLGAPRQGSPQTPPLAPTMSDGQAMGILEEWRVAGLLDDALWHQIVRRTPLRDQHAASADWSGRDGTSAEQDALLRGSVTRLWKAAHARDLAICVTRAVCNEIAEMAAHARGVLLAGGIAADAAFERLEEVPEQESTDDDDDGGTPPQGDGRGASSLGGLTGAFTLVNGHKLFRMRTSPPRLPADDPSRVRVGDLVFFLGWRPLTNADEPWSVVRTDCDMEFWVQALSTRQDPGATDTQGAATLTLHFAGHDEHLHAEPLPDALLARGAAARAPALGACPVPQLFAVARMLGSRTGMQVVRRHPGAAVFHQQLVWTHLATVIHVGQQGLVTFETNAPTGVRFRPYGSLVRAWNTAFGRPAGQADRPELAHFLDRENLLHPRRLTGG